MFKKCLFIVLVLLVSSSYIFAASANKLQNQIDQATIIIRQFNEMPEDSIPPSIIQNSKGLAIISVLKGGFIIGARGGSGVVIAKDANGNWTAPSSVTLGGGSLGFQIGAEEADYVLVLNNDAAVEALSTSNCTLGGNASVAAGPVGRSAEGDVTTVAAIYTYSRSKGLFAGVSIEGAVLDENEEANAAFYGRDITAKEILSGSVPQPATARALYDALAQ